MGNDLTVQNTEVRCGTLLISKGLDRDNFRIMSLIEKHKEQFLRLGEIPKVTIHTSSAGRPVMEYKLNNNQLMFLLSMLRGTGVIVDFKCEAIKAGSMIAVLTALNDFDFGESQQRYVYAAQDDFGNIKIGISNDPEARVKNLNIGNPCELKLIFSREAKQERYKDETLLHGQCEKYNIRSEWFSSEAVELLK